MARTALDSVSMDTENPQAPSVAMLLDHVWSAADPELAPFRDTVRFDLAALSDVRLPPQVADALISATVQALTNSLTHAGTAARPTVTAARLADGGLRITVSDTGDGFDIGAIPEAR